MLVRAALGRLNHEDISTTIDTTRQKQAGACRGFSASSMRMPLVLPIWYTRTEALLKRHGKDSNRARLSLEIIRIDGTPRSEPG